MTAALEGGEWSAARSGRTFPPGKTRYPFYRRLGRPQGRSGRAESPVPTGILSRTVQPVVSRYTDWATRPTKTIITAFKYLFVFVRIRQLYDSFFIKMHLSCCMSYSAVNENSSVFRTQQNSYFLTRPSKNRNRPNFRKYFFLIRDDRKVQKPNVNIIYYRHSPLKLNNISGSSGFTTNGFSTAAVAISAQNKLKLFQVTLDFSFSRVFQKLHSYGLLLFFFFFFFFPPRPSL